MKIILLGSGGRLPAEVSAELSRDHEIVAVVMPGRKSIWRLWLSRMIHFRAGPDPLVRAARERRIRVMRVASGHDPRLTHLVTETTADLICVASFPWLLPMVVFDAPRLGTINLHTSLLPQHRGASPMFWTYYHDDRKTGITVHRVTSRADQGAILGQEEILLRSDLTIQELYDESARRGASLMAKVVRELALGICREFPQDEHVATKDPRVSAGQPMVDFANWQVDRVWRFLHGLYPHFQEPVREPSGRQVRYYGVGGFERTSAQSTLPLGTAEPSEYGWQLHCRDGYVHLLKRRASRKAILGRSMSRSHS